MLSQRPLFGSLLVSLMLLIRLLEGRNRGQGGSRFIDPILVSNSLIVIFEYMNYLRAVIAASDIVLSCLGVIDEF